MLNLAAAAHTVGWCSAESCDARVTSSFNEEEEEEEDDDDDEDDEGMSGRPDTQQPISGSCARASTSESSNSTAWRLSCKAMNPVRSVAVGSLLAVGSDSVIRYCARGVGISGIGAIGVALSERAGGHASTRS